MKRKIRLIGLDLDGTTLNEEGQITPFVRETIEKAIESGIVVLPATGRQHTGIPEEFLSIPGVKYALSSNGALVTDVSTGEIIHADCFTPQDALPILNLAKENNVVSAVYIDSYGFTDTNDVDKLEEYKTVFPPEMMDYFKKTRKHVPDLQEYILQENKAVEKFAFIFPDYQKKNHFFYLLNKLGGSYTTSSLDLNLETNTLTANKGSALLALGKKLGISKKEIMGVGDASNDEDMLRTVGYSVAMGNASPHIKKIADHVTLTCNQDGVAHAILKIL